MRFFTFKQSALKLAIASALVLGGVSTALAGTVGGSVTAINTISQTDAAAITIGSSSAGAANGQTDTTIVSGQLDNNNSAGWRMKVVSTNTGKLLKGSGGAGREILYTNVKFVKTGGDLGAGLSNPHNQDKNIVTGASGGGTAGTTNFSTGASLSALGTATTGTVALLYALKITWASDLALLAGTYSDTITLTFANDDTAGI